jgi:hypothetical protein
MLTEVSIHDFATRSSEKSWMPTCVGMTTWWQPVGHGQGRLILFGRLPQCCLIPCGIVSSHGQRDARETRPEHLYCLRPATNADSPSSSQPSISSVPPTGTTTPSRTPANSSA